MGSDLNDVNLTLKDAAPKVEYKGKNNLLYRKFSILRVFKNIHKIPETGVQSPLDSEGKTMLQSAESIRNMVETVSDGSIKKALENNYMEKTGNSH